MHQQAMMHCDVKEPNLMLRTDDYHNPEIVIIDFGVAKAMTKDDGMCSGTPGYMPPETMNTGKWHARGDVFSMGVVMMQLLTRKVPDEDLMAQTGRLIGVFLDGCQTMDDIKMAVNTRQPPFHLMPPQMSGLTQICRKCLDKNFKNRPKAPVVLKDPWFQSSVGQANIPIEQAMNAASDFCTVGITADMVASVPATMAIGQYRMS
jgi:serine/threonine protein kinase